MSLTENKKLILYIIFAFVFSFTMRLIWISEFKDMEQFKFNNEFMINTNDGYIWAEGARDILAGTHQENDLSPVDSATSVLTAFLVKILPFSFETIIFYMPAFFGSLLIVPLILIGHSIKKSEVGLIAALIGSIAHSYYNRTMVGYYDTDLLNIVFPTLLLWSLILALRTKEDKYILFMAIDIIAYRWWYPQSYSLEFAFFGLIACYVIYQYFKRQDFQFNFIILTFMMFAMMGLDGIYRFLIVIFLFGFLKSKNDLFIKYLPYVFLTSVVLFFVSGGFDPILGQLKGYVFKDAVLVSGEDLKLHFYTVMQTVREAGRISFTTFGERISGHIITFLASVIGYIWLCVRFPIMLLGLPLVGLGFLALFGGLRFTIYAVPVMALGIGFLITECSKKMTNNKNIQVLAGGVLTLLVLFPNIKHIESYKVPTVFSKDEVLVLDELKSIASREDYVVGWWDYGYPIRYYADVKTISDGGKHEGDVVFSTSFALTSPQEVAAKMIRLDVEYTEKKFGLKEDDIDKNRTNIASMMLDNGFKDTNDFLLALNKKNIKMLPKTRDIYLFLPYSMMNIYSTVKLFSNIDLMSGMMGENPFFYQTTDFNENSDSIKLGSGIQILKKNGLLQVGQNSVKIKRFVNVKYISKERLDIDMQEIFYDGAVSVVYMENYQQFLVVDEETYNSTYFQLFVLENYDNKLFEPTILTPLLKVYKLKI